MRKFFLTLFEITVAFAVITFIILFLRAIKSNDIDFAVFFGIFGLFFSKLFFKIKTE